MINLILLAAGYSSRFGENKLLYEVDGLPMFRHMLDNSLAFQESSKQKVRVILVTAYDEIRQYAVHSAGFIEQETDVESGSAGDAPENPINSGERYLVINRNQDAGISHSIRLGIKNALLSCDEDSVMFAVCDQPYLTSRDLCLLAKGFYGSGKGIGGLSAAGVIGNPVIFKKKYRDELSALTGDKGGKQIVNRHPEDVYRCEAVTVLSLKDIDRKE